MIETQEMNRDPEARELVHILWRCDACSSFISTHSAEIVHLSACPVCSEIPLKYCGTFENIAGLSEQDEPQGLLH